MLASSTLERSLAFELMPSGFQGIAVMGLTKIYNIYSYTLCGLLELVESFCSFATVSIPIHNLIQQGATRTKIFSCVVATSLHMRDKALGLWLEHLASLIGCMSSTGVSDPLPHLIQLALKGTPPSLR